MLEQSRRERHQRVREAVRDTARLPKLDSKRTVVAIAVIVIALVLVFALHQSSSGPSLTTSCSTPAIALDSSSTGTGRGIDYAITGPKTGTYVIAVDATSVAVHGSTVTISPRQGFAVAVHQGLGSCKAHGTLPTLTSGAHQVELFRDGMLTAKAALR
jgi:multisubunit Na+/H+ antiporter MnhF subunit